MKHWKGKGEKQEDKDWGDMKNNGLRHFLNKVIERAFLILMGIEFHCLGPAIERDVSPRDFEPVEIE